MLRELTRHRLACVEEHCAERCLVVLVIVGDETPTGRQSDPWRKVAGQAIPTGVECDAAKTGDNGQPRPLAAKVLRGTTWDPRIELCSEQRRGVKVRGAVFPDP